MMDIKKTIIQALADAVEKAGVEVSVEKLDLEHPAVESHGDYSGNISLVLFPSLRAKRGNLVYSSPRQLAEAIVTSLSSNKVLKKAVSRIEVAGPGFINFHLKTLIYLNELKKLNEKRENYGQGSLFQNQKIIVEYTDPNPFKEFHIGHLYSNIVGESLAKLFESQKAIVKRANYQGDVGMHVAKAVWGMIQLKDRMPGEDASLKDRAKFMGQAYAFGANKFEKSEKIKIEITEINKKIYNQDPEVANLYRTGRQWSLEYFETVYKRLGTEFDFYFFESEVGKIGYQFVRKNLTKGVFEKSRGAVIFPGHKFGLHDRVFINSLDIPTYEAKDLGLAPAKYQQFSYDLSVIVTGNEIKEYFKVVLTALKQINPDLWKKTRHISHGMVKLPAGKMSSRTGKIITGEWLLDQAVQKAREVAREKNVQTSDKSIGEQVGVGAIKYSLLKSGIGNDVIFDFHESVSFEGNSGPYLQYTYARTQSVLEKADVKKRLSLPQSKNDPYRINPEELAILRWIYRFPEVVETAALQYAPNLVCTFLYELAQRFNTFYHKHRILDSSANDRQSLFRLLLTSAVAQVLKNGLTLLGIQTPENM